MLIPNQMKKNTRKYHAFPRNLPSCWKNKIHTFENNINILPILTNLSISVVAQSCLTLCDPMNCRPPGSSVHGILQARILKWLAMPSSRGSSQPRDQTCISLHFLRWQVGSLPLVPPGKPSPQTVSTLKSGASLLPSLSSQQLQRKHFIDGKETVLS